MDADLRQTLRVKGLARAKTFTWQATAQKTLEVYLKSVGDKPSPSS
jgi:hypothetical protein